MMKISESRLYSIIEYLYSLTVIVVVGAIFLLLHYIRIKFVLFFGVNFISVRFSYVIYAPILLIGYFDSKKIRNKFKGLIFSPSFLSRLNESVKKPNIADYGITENELQEYQRRNTIDTEFYSGIIAGCVIMYFIFSSINNVEEFEFLKLSLCLFFVFIAKKILDRRQLVKDRKWAKYNLLNQYIKDLRDYYSTVNQIK